MVDRSIVIFKRVCASLLLSAGLVLSGGISPAFGAGNNGDGNSDDTAATSAVGGAVALRLTT